MRGTCGRLCGDALELLAYRRRRLSHVVTDTLQCDDSRDVEVDLGVTVFDGPRRGAGRATRRGVRRARRPASTCEIAQRSGARRLSSVHREAAVAPLDAGTGELRHGRRERLHGPGRLPVALSPVRAVAARSASTAALGTLTEAEFDYAEYLPDWHPYEDYRTSYAARADLGGGVVLTQIHDYDLACWLFGAPARVVASGGHLSALDIDVEDTVDAMLEVWHRSRCACVRASRRRIAPHDQRESATAVSRFDLVSAAARVEVTTGESRACRSPGIAEPDVPRRSQHFLDCLAGRGPTGDSARVEGIGVLRVAVEVKAALRARQPVDLTWSRA